jgi:hypothetical protein
MSGGRTVLVAWVILCLLGATASAVGLRSIGVRVVLPIGETPFLYGVEATADLTFGIATGSFFLSQGGGALIMGSCDVLVAGDEGAGKTFVRLTTGLFYFDLSNAWPSLLFGGGLGIEVPITPAFAVGAAGEFLYPLAIPLPLVSASGRWLVP